MTCVEEDSEKSSDKSKLWKVRSDGRALMGSFSLLGSAADDECRATAGRVAKPQWGTRQRATAVLAAPAPVLAGQSKLHPASRLGPKCLHMAMREQSEEAHFTSSALRLEYFIMPFPLVESR